LRQRLAWFRGASPPATEQAAAAGRVAAEFAGVARLQQVRDKDAALMLVYLDNLSRLRSRLNQLKNQGDPGPGARQFMQQTLDGNGSELADALKYVDEQILVGMNDSQRQILRPLLVRPLMQTFAVIVQPTETELNRTWQAQVYAPFNAALAAKAPFAPGAVVAANPAEIAQFLGPDGAVARFVKDSLGPLVVRRGDVVAPRTWGGVGVGLQPEALQGFPVWLAGAAQGTEAATPSGAPVTYFQMRASALSGALEYTVDIDGQQLRSRGAVGWIPMQYPVQGGAGGVTIRALTMDGRTLDVFADAGAQGLRRMVDAATRRRRDDGTFELTWVQGRTSVSVDLKIQPQGQGAAGMAARLQGLRLPARIAGSATLVASAGGAP
jgi:type VI secretion system protein ImpL